MPTLPGLVREDMTRIFIPIKVESPTNKTHNKEATHPTSECHITVKILCKPSMKLCHADACCGQACQNKRAMHYMSVKTSMFSLGLHAV